MRKLKAFGIFSTLVLIIISIDVFFENELFTNVAAPLLWPSNVSCYFIKSRGILELGLGEWDEAMLIPDRCIFFLETKCFDSWGTGDVILDRESACAIETAAKTNPTLNIFLLYLTPKKFTKKSAVFVKKLESYNNIYVRRVRLSSYFDETPLRDWFSRNMRNILNEGDPRRIIFELVRITTLWKYGGIFVHTDLIVETPLEEFSNFVAKWKNIESALLGIGISTELGKNLVEFALKEIADSYKIKPVDTMRILEKFFYTRVRQRKTCEFTIYPSIGNFSRGKNNNGHCPKVYEND